MDVNWKVKIATQEDKMHIKTNSDTYNLSKVTKIISIFLFTVVLASACTSVSQSAMTTANVTTSTTANATALPATCKVYSMKSWFELGWPLDGSFSFSFPSSDGGVTSGLRLDKDAIDAIKSMNVGMWSWQWAADAERGRMYQSIPGVSIDQAVYWNWVGPASPDQRIPAYAGVRNYVCVSKIVRMYGEDYAFIVGAPKGLNYKKYQLDWLVQPVYGDWEWQTKDGTWAGFPHIYNGYMFDPASGFAMRSASDKQFRFPAAWLYAYVRTDTIPWLVSQTSTPIVDITVTASTTPTKTPTFTPTPTLTSTATIAPTFTTTPSSGTVVWITANPYLSVRPGYSTSNVPVGFFYIGTRLTLSEIRTVGSDWWGREGNGYWIALLLNGKYYTTWRP